LRKPTFSYQMDLPQKPQIAVRAFINNVKGKILIIKRANTSYGNEKWNLPGGKIEFGETAEQALIKEIKEELNLKCIHSGFLFYMDNIPDKSTDLHFVTLFFKCECEGEIQINKESSDYVWIGYKELSKYKIAFGQEKAISQYFKLQTKI
jgi:8-oxo-dGTP diphosphatase